MSRLQLVEVDSTRLPANGGARFFRCALQVNPYPYLVRHSKPTSFADEASYNEALVEGCKSAGIEVIGVTDHYRVSSSTGLIASAEKSGLVVFPGFEAVSKDGVHFLCLFSPGTAVTLIERRIGECGIAGEEQESPVGTYDALELMECCARWEAVCIAAHVAAAGGLLKRLSGQSAINAWQSEHLLACGLPGPIGDASTNLRPILENKNAQYRRDRSIAVVNAQDVTDPSDLQKPGTSTAIKMSRPGYEGLKLAFLDPESRIRLASDREPKPHTELVSVEWEGGFLDGVAIQFNENLNVLIGGRGTGKSTVIESIRYVLGLVPVGKQAREAHDALVSQVLRSGTRISLRLRSPHPALREYRIERTVPNQPVVKDNDGELLDLMPADVSPRLEVYGQHEISELARDSEQRTRLLARFLERGAERADSSIVALRSTRKQLLAALESKRKLESRLAQLPSIVETLKRYEEAGLEDKLKHKSQLVREQHLLEEAAERLTATVEDIDTLEGSFPIDHELLSVGERKELPDALLLVGAEQILSEFSQKASRAVRSLRKALISGENEMRTLRERWDTVSQASDDDYQRTLRELQHEEIDGAEFIRLRQQIEKLEALQAQLTKANNTLEEAVRARESALVKFEEVKAAEFRALERAAKKVSRELRGRVRVKVTFHGNREPLLKLLRDQIGGRLIETCDRLAALDQVSLSALSAACRSGTDSLVNEFGIPATQAPRLAKAKEEVFLAIEELELPATTTLELNVGSHPQEAWRALEDLSAGQKATAVLLLLLLESDAPLVVDQPEDDLDNRFITDSVVPQVREEKRRRQFVFATHNANIPVLGDAELIAGLSAHGDDGQVQASIPADYLGSLDLRTVREHVEEVLEGGKAAFELRRLKYGF